MTTLAQTTRLVALAGLALSSSAFATTRSWLNGGGGFVSTAANWNPAGVPVAADVLNFNLAGAYSVTFDAAVPTVSTDNFGPGTVSISATSPHTASSQLVVGFGGAGTVNLVAGSFSVGGTIGIGSAGIGNMNITGPTSSLLGTNSAGLLRVGNGGGGTSTLNILNGGLAQMAGGVSVGAFGGNSGVVLVSGINGSTASRLITTDAVAGDITIGSAGNGTMTATAGAIVTCADDCIIAPSAGFAGTLNVGTGAGSTVNVAGDMLIASNSTAAAAGTGTVDLSFAGLINVTGVTRVGDPDGGTGLLRLSGNAQILTSGLNVDPAHGAIQNDAGHIFVVGAPCVIGTPDLIINGLLATDSPSMAILTGATMNLAGGIVVGTTHQGLLSVVDINAAVTTGAGNGIILGQSGSAHGTLDVHARGSVSGVASLLVGQNGAGTLLISSGGTVSTNACNIGTQVGSSGVATIDGTGSRLSAGVANLYVGGNSGGSAGSGDMTISSGGTVSVSGDATFWNTGALTMNSGTLSVGGTLTFNQGASTLTNCTINANVMVVNNTDISASGVINARYSMTSGTTNLIATGPLTVGNASAPDGVACFGTTNVGAFPVTLLDSNSALPSFVVINGGSLTAVNGITIAGNKSITGTGTINGAVSNSGSISATGISGLIFNGLVSGIGQGIGGTIISFGSTGGFTGAGSIIAQVINNGTITATGPLSMGDGSPAGVQTPGTLNVGIHHVTLNDSNGLPVGQCTIGGGDLELIGASSVRNLNTSISSHLKGFGTLTTPIFKNLNGGQISPGNPGSTGTGVLRFTGEFSSFQAGNIPGTLNIDIRDSESVDQLIIGSSATVAGTLNVSLLDGFVPTPGTRFSFFRAGSVSGTFDTLNIPAGAAIIYNSDNVQILFPCPADFNLDGTVDFFDYLDFVDAFSAATPNADFNNDSAIDFFDYLDFVDAFSAGC